MIEHEYGRVIHHGGRTFFATETMGEIFAAAASDVVSRGDTELVPLLHRGGVDLLLVGPGIPLAVTTIDVGRPTVVAEPHTREAG
ncbi:hypothetical protein [Herbiconiux liangxiaofengii]|uniref:hypothetical protein n=1 Tax=Herbiconiux liangxiaofengii TaxID=3342795 RepID=UPI0035B78762